jgi:hypothetical protein
MFNEIIANIYFDNEPLEDIEKKRLLKLNINLCLSKTMIDRSLNLYDSDYKLASECSTLDLPLSYFNRYQILVTKEGRLTAKVYAVEL